MASVVFNPFKQRFINGEVPSADTWNFIPVNRKFKKEFAESSEYKLEQLRDINDFKMVNSSAWDDSLFQGMRRDITWFKPVQTSGEQIPMFITSGAYDENGNMVKTDNWSKFRTTEYFKDVSANNHIQDYLEDGGFYYLRSKEELRWFANHVNTENNCVNGVLGDSIEGVIQNQVGSSEAMPFQGVLDGNGYTINGTIICDNDDNGLVGILGEKGVVRNFRIKGSDDPTLVCKKTINLNHIKNDGRDINAGILVGRNYGTVENIDASDLNKFTFSGFVPQVYSVTNKSDEYTDFGTIRPKYDNGENFFFLNSWCVNSPGNICPYVGYFAEGIYAEMGSGYENRGKICCREYSPKQKSDYAAGIEQNSIVFSQENMFGFAFFNKYAASGENFLENKISSGDAALVDVLNKNLTNLSVSHDPLARNAVFMLGMNSNGRQYVAEIHGTAYEVNDYLGHVYFNAGHIETEKLPWFVIDKGTDNVKYCDFEAAGIDTNDSDEMTTIETKELVYSLDDGYVKENGSVIDLNADNALGYGDDVHIYLSTGYVHFDGQYQKYTDADPSIYSHRSYQYFSVSDTTYSTDETDVKIFTLDGQPIKTAQFDVSSLKLDLRLGSERNGVAKLYTGFDLLLSADVYATFNAKYNDTEHSLKWNESALNTYLQSLDGTYFGYWAGKKKYIFMPNHARVTAATPIIPLLHILENIDQFVTVVDGTALPSVVLKRAVIENLALCTETVIDTKVEDVTSLMHTDRTDIINGAYGYVVEDLKNQNIFGKYFNARTELGKVSLGTSVTDYEEIKFWTSEGTSLGIVTSLFGNVTGFAPSALNMDEAKGTISFNLIDTKSMFYRPFLHANTNGSELESLIIGDEYGTKLGDVEKAVLANWSSLSQTYETVQDAVDAVMHSIALRYVHDPRYYGLDKNGNWTAQSIRFRLWLQKMGDAKTPLSNGKYDPNYTVDEIHYNWNIEKATIKAETEIGQNMTDYAELYDTKGESCNRYEMGALLLPREIMGVPLRMPNMGRVAYNISPVVGANFGTIQNVSVKGVRKNLGNFVGFIGGVAGKQERGKIENVSCEITDDFEWFREEPKVPDITFGNNAGVISELTAKYNQEMLLNNYHVRYKMTPIIPGAKTELLTEVSKDPALNADKYRVYPAGVAVSLNEDAFPVGDEWNDDDKTAAFVEYLTALQNDGIHVYRVSDSDEGEVQFSTEHSSLYPSFRNNPDYLADNKAIENTQPVLDFLTEWYTNKTVPTGLPTDDVLTFKLRPIFNAGGVFGRIIPDTAKTAIKDVNAKYDILTDSENKDMHCAFGSLAGLVEMQTTHLGQQNSNYGKLLNLQGVNAVSNVSKLSPIGFISQEFNENVNLQKLIWPWLNAPGHQTWTLDTCNRMHEKILNHTNRQDTFAPTNQASTSFYGVNSVGGYASYADSLKTNGGIKWVNADDVKTYTKGVIDDIIGLQDVNSDSEKFAEFAPLSHEIFINKDSVIKSVQSVYGSNTSYLPSVGVNLDKTRKAIEMTSASNVPDFGSHQEMLDDRKPSKLFYRDLEDYSASNLGFTSAADFTQNMIAEKDVFQNKDVSTDIYFSYSYNATDTFVPDWTFKHNVQFNSAVKTDDLNKDGSVYDKFVYGYTFSDDLAYPGDGFDYEHNYLHLGNSIAPSYLRRKINENGTWQTSAVSAVMPSAGKYVAADDDHQFGGILVTDSSGRNVMFIDNTDNADLDNLTYNVKMPAVHLNDESSTQAGMLLEVK